MPISSTYESLLKNLAQHDVVITATHRLANYLIHQHTELQKTNTQRIRVQPSIVSFSEWLKRLWKGLTTEDLLLSISQERVLWQVIIQKTGDLFSSDVLVNTAKLAQEAMSLMQHYRVPDISAEARFKVHRQFQAWCDTFKATCREKKWISQAELPFYLGGKFQDGYFTVPDKIYLVGFVDLPPAYENFLSNLEALGSSVDRLCGDDDLGGAPVRIEFDTNEEEVLTMARWAKEIWQQDPQKNNICCVVPQLEQRRTEVLNAFRQVFKDDLSLPKIGTGIEISAPILLSEISLVAVALRIFELEQDHLSLNKLRILLRTPYIGAAQQEWMSRASLHHHLRSLSYEEVSIEMVLTLSQSIEQSFYCPKWSEQISKFRAQCAELTSMHVYPSEWVKVFDKLLEILGWPGDRALTKEEFDIVDEFQKVLNTFSELDCILGQISWEKAKKLLEDLVSQQSHSLRGEGHSEGYAQIQILGALESVAIPFTHKWVLGLTDAIWPQSAQPHPFIPAMLQKQYDLPHSSAERELDFCEKLTHQFNQLTHQVIFSYARYQGDVEQRPSQLIQNFSVIDVGALGLKKSFLNFDHSCFEYLEDENAPLIPQGESIKGGSYLFKLQAACPFRAFAEIRLNAKSQSKMRLHLNAKEKGSLIHRCLEKLWRVIKNHHQLMMLSENDLHQIIKNVVETSLNEYMSAEASGNLVRAKARKSRSLKLAPAEAGSEGYSGFYRVEGKRLINLLKKWIELYEKPRSAFRIYALEAIEKVELQGHHYSFKIDRIDELEDGQKIVIDYKTGLVSKDDWVGTRLNEPQLPLYGTTSHFPIDALVYAQLKNTQLCYKGVATEGINIEGLEQLSPEEWRQQKLQWSNDLNNLALQFTHGDARVDPKEGVSTCRFCSLKMFCRVGET